MATNKKTATDEFLVKMKKLAIDLQQYFYEYLPECTIYEYQERKYLKQNIGYALYGPPTSNEDASEIEKNIFNCKSEDQSDANTDIADTVEYTEQAKKFIDLIYDKICACSNETDDFQPIYFSVIYNVIYDRDMKVKSKKNEEVKKEVKKEVKEEESKEAKKEEDEPELSMPTPVPVFKVRKNIQKKSKDSQKISSKVEDDYETWYIDTSCRVYKSWEDYETNNNLPECTMVLPKDGFYQADPSHIVTENNSTVWLEIIDSPACKWTTKICNGMDIASSAVGICAAGLCVASMFTPIAPVVAVSGFVAGSATSVWTIGRSSQQLVDRSNHEESINVLDKEAFKYWLVIAGSTVGLGTVGGSAAISTATARGMAIPTFVRTAFNTVVGGNLLLNGVGIAFQGYCMFDKYRTEQTWEYGDVLNFATHIMFFANSVVQIQFADDIIRNTQGRIVNHYRDNLRNKNLRKKFNRIVRRANQNNTSKISENAEVIRYIRHRQQLTADQPFAGGNNSGTHQTIERISRDIRWSFNDGKLRVNGIVLLDPIEYVNRLARSDIFTEAQQNDQSRAQNYVNCNVEQLAITLCVLLTDLYTSNNCPRDMPIVPDFDPLLKDMSSMNINTNCLKKLFAIVIELIKRSDDMEDFLLKAFTFVWRYCKMNFMHYGINLYDRRQNDSRTNILRNIISVILEAIDMILDNLYTAFMQYIQNNLYALT